MHFHLWLKPAGKLYDRLSRLMTDLRQEFRGPEFNPHVTLLGEIKGKEQECCLKAQELAQSVHPLEMRMKEPAYQDDYFHCLFFPLEHTPALLNAHRKATGIFGRTTSSRFHPHVSLLYGLYPSRVKEHMIGSLPRDLPATGVANELLLVRAESMNPRDWQVVKACLLGV